MIARIVTVLRSSESNARHQAKRRFGDLPNHAEELRHRRRDGIRRKREGERCAQLIEQLPAGQPGDPPIQLAGPGDDQLHLLDLPVDHGDVRTQPFALGGDFRGLGGSTLLGRRAEGIELGLERFEAGLEFRLDPLGLGADLGELHLDLVDPPALQTGRLGLLVDLIQDQVPDRQLDFERQRLILPHSRCGEHQPADCQSGNECGGEA